LSDGNNQGEEVSDDDDSPLDVNEQWHTCLIAAQLHFQRALLRTLINKNVLDGEEARALMFEAWQRFLADPGSACPRMAPP
jgi:hypothetical protein